MLTLIQYINRLNFIDITLLISKYVMTKLNLQNLFCISIIFSIFPTFWNWKISTVLCNCTYKKQQLDSILFFQKLLPKTNAVLNRLWVLCHNQICSFTIQKEVNLLFLPLPNFIILSHTQSFLAVRFYTSSASAKNYPY
jgi:hypothetical protein